jgi:hypothetical protein
MKNFNLYIALAAICAILLLFAIDFSSLFLNPFPETYLGHNEIRGIAVQHEQLLYTLNFKQENELVDLFNQTTFSTVEQKQQEVPFPKIIVYRFHQPEIEIGVGKLANDQLIFTAPTLKADGVFLDRSQGRLNELLSETYDP